LSQKRHTPEKNVYFKGHFKANGSQPATTTKPRSSMICYDCFCLASSSLVVAAFLLFLLVVAFAGEPATKITAKGK